MLSFYLSSADCDAQRRMKKVEAPLTTRRLMGLVSNVRRCVGACRSRKVVQTQKSLLRKMCKFEVVVMTVALGSPCLQNVRIAIVWVHVHGVPRWEVPPVCCGKMSRRLVASRWDRKRAV